MQDNKLIPQITILSRIHGHRTGTTPMYPKCLLSGLYLSMGIRKKHTNESYWNNTDSSWLHSSPGFPFVMHQDRFLKYFNIPPLQ